MKFKFRNGNILLPAIIPVTILIAFLVNSCANVGMPSGGVKDTDPPRVVQSQPPDKSKNFHGQVIKITFDEFVQLKNISKALIVSPPVKKKPEIIMKNKTLVIDLNNPLRDSTTYTLNFGDAISDLNEGNVLKNFRFVFSTGNMIDSLQVGGILTNAFTSKPEKEVLVMLYPEGSDSAPLKELPVYVSRTGDKGDFLISNIRKDTYKVFALKDDNNNYIFDQPTEAIAYFDHPIIPTAALSLKADTLKVLMGDSAWYDSIRNVSVTMFAPANLRLSLFQEVAKKRILTKHERPARNQCNLYFNQPLTENPVFNPMNFTPAADWISPEYNKTRDSIICWITDSLVASRDTIRLLVTYRKNNETGEAQLRTDTVVLGFKPKPIKKHETPKPVVLKTGCSVQKSKKLDYDKDIIFDFSAPVKSIDTSKIQLYNIVDSIQLPLHFRFKKDSFLLRRYTLSTTWTDGMRYGLLIPPGTFHDIAGNTNDTVKSTFILQKKEFYGNIILKINNLSSNGIVQLMNEKDVVLKEAFINSGTTVRFDNINPATYHLKFIFDDNWNKKWDTGNYIKKLQPEKVLLYKEDVKVRSNWDVELTWDVSAQGYPAK
ncbi:MAG: Ig-like domain-containing protein [Bacteroidia bacterium]|nr:Ig-like domain-containing protein [Bacteroidia bacterium]